MRTRWMSLRTHLPLWGVATVFTVAACAGGAHGGRVHSGVVPVSALPGQTPAADTTVRPTAPRGVVSASALQERTDTIRRCRTVRTSKGQQVQCALVPATAGVENPVTPVPSAPVEVKPAPAATAAPVTAAVATAAKDAVKMTSSAGKPERTPVLDAVAAGTAGTGDDAGPIVTLNFLEDPLADVLSLFSAQAGRSIIASDDKDVMNKKITGDIRAQPWRRAMSLLMRSHGLRVVEDSVSGVLTVVSESRSLSSCLPRVMRLEYAYAEDIVPLVKDLMGMKRGENGEAGGGAAGCDRAEVVATGNKDGKSSTFVIFTTDDRMKELQHLVSLLDVRRPMVGIQVRMVFVNRSQLQKFGWQYTLTNQNSTTTNNSTSNGLNTLTGVQVSPVGGTFNQQNSAGGGSGRPFTVLQKLALGGATSLNMFVEAMQSIGLAQTEAQPMIVTSSESTANISVGEFFIMPQSQPLVTGGGVGTNGQVNNGGVGTIGGTGVGQQNVNPGANPGGGGVGVTNQGLSNPAFGFAQFQTGTVLKVTPQVLKSGEIRVAVEISRDGGNLGSSGQGLSGARQYATTNVIVQNGQDIPIGGMRVLSKSTTKGGIPILSSIPLIGRLFRTNEEAELFQDLMIIVTPTLIEQKP